MSDGWLDSTSHHRLSDFLGRQYITRSRETLPPCHLWLPNCSSERTHCRINPPVEYAHVKVTNHQPANYAAAPPRITKGTQWLILRRTPEATHSRSPSWGYASEADAAMSLSTDTWTWSYKVPDTDHFGNETKDRRGIDYWRFNNLWLIQLFPVGEKGSSLAPHCSKWIPSIREFLWKWESHGKLTISLQTRCEQ